MSCFHGWNQSQKYLSRFTYTYSTKRLVTKNEMFKVKTIPCLYSWKLRHSQMIQCTYICMYTKVKLKLSIPLDLHDNWIICRFTTGEILYLRLASVSSNNLLIVLMELTMQDIKIFIFFFFYYGKKQRQFKKWIKNALRINPNNY